MHKKQEKIQMAIPNSQKLSLSKDLPQLTYQLLTLDPNRDQKYYLKLFKKWSLEISNKILQMDKIMINQISNLILQNYLELREKLFSTLSNLNLSNPPSKEPIVSLLALLEQARLLVNENLPPN